MSTTPAPTTGDPCTGPTEAPRSLLCLLDEAGESLDVAFFDDRERVERFTDRLDSMANSLDTWAKGDHRADDDTLRLIDRYYAPVSCRLGMLRHELRDWLRSGGPFQRVRAADLFGALVSQRSDTEAMIVALGRPGGQSVRGAWEHIMKARDELLERELVARYRALAPRPPVRIQPSEAELGTTYGPPIPIGDAPNVPHTEHLTPAEQEALQALKDLGRPSTAEEISNRVGEMTEGSARQHLGQLKKKGLVKHTRGYGYWLKEWAAPDGLPST